MRVGSHVIGFIISITLMTNIMGMKAEYKFDINNIEVTNENLNDINLSMLPVRNEYKVAMNNFYITMIN